MDISIFGKSYFTEDGFDVENYKEQDLRRAICKVSKNVVDPQQAAIVTASHGENDMPMIATYGKCVAPLVSPRNYLDHFKQGALLPTVNGIIVCSDEEIKVLGYGNRDDIFLALESADGKFKGLVCVADEHNMSRFYRKISLTLDGVLGEKGKVYVLNLSQSRAEEYERILNGMKLASVLTKGLSSSIYNFTSEQLFEVYTESDDEAGIMKNFIVTV